MSASCAMYSGLRSNAGKSSIVADPAGKCDNTEKTSHSVNSYELVLESKKAASGSRFSGACQSPLDFGRRHYA